MNSAETFFGWSPLIPLICALAGIFYDKWLSREKRFSDACDALRNQILVRKSDALQLLVGQVMSGFDNVGLSEKDLYLLFFQEMMQHSRYYETVEKVQRRFEGSRVVVFCIVGVELLAFGFGMLGVLSHVVAVYLLGGGFILTFALVLVGLRQDWLLNELKKEPKLFPGRS